MGVRRIILVRGGPEAEAFAAMLAADGFDAWTEASLRPEPLAHAAAAPSCGAILLTSANGARFGAAQFPGGPPMVPVWAVGDATAAAARDAGFQDPRSAAGDAAALAAAVSAAPPDGLALHLAGEAVAGDLAGALAAAGIAYQRRIVYRMRPSAALSDRTAAAFAQDADLAMLLFFSAHGVAAFAALAPPSARAVKAITMSPTVAAAAEAAGWRDVRIAPRPDRTAMRTALRQAAGVKSDSHDH